MNGDESFNGPNVVPLRTILRKFLNLVDNYEARRNGGLDSYESEFQELKQYSESLKADPDHVCREGEKNVNRKKNRYKDILPYDFSRVIISDYGDVPGSDYINANFIKGASGSSAYIACQGPLPHTVNEFWRMVVECEVQVIVMACNEQESGKHKCENYWVEEDGVEREFGQVTVWLKKCRNVCPDFLVRTMRIRFTNSRGESEERNVCQFHYSAWPDHGVPTKVRPLLDMVRLIRDCQTSETLPVLVHCSAGCGRTGTICAIDYVWGLLRLGRLTPDFSLFNLVRDMRSQRIAMVQTKDQYILVHRAVKELFQEQLKIIDAHPYANVDVNGLPLEIKRELQEPTYETLEFKSPKNPLTFVLNSDSNSSYVDNNNIVVSVSNVNTQSNYQTNNSTLPLPLPPKPTDHKTTDAPSSSPLSSTGSGSAGASGEESRETSLEKSTRANGSAGRVNNKISNSSSNGHGLQSSSSSSEVHSEKVLKGSSSLATHPNSENNNTTADGPSTKTSSSNPLRSALLRKPSISKLKSFFEKTLKEDKEKDKDKDVKKGSTQLSRAKSDVSTRFYAFKDFTSSFTSRTPPPPSPLVAAPTPATDKEKLNSDVKSENSSAVAVNHSQNNKSTAEIAKISAPSKKPAVPSSKPVLSIKRSKSLKVPSKLTTTTINYQNNISGNSISGKDVHLQSKASNSIHSSSSGGSGSSGFSSTITDNPIKVCVKQVEIPKLQSVVSKSIKPEVLLATSSATRKARPSQEYDYDIDDRSHLRQQKPMSTSSSSVFQLQQESFQPSQSSSSSPEGSSDSNVKPVPTSRMHILKDNHSYANVIYGNSNHSTSSSNGNSSIHRTNGRSRTMEDIQDFPSSSSNGQDNNCGNGLKLHGKLKKCDTVNPRILAASLGYTHPAHERSSILTRSHSHVWQPDKLSSSSQLSLQQQEQQSTPIRIFSSDNIHQPSSASSPGNFKVNSSSIERNSSSPGKTITMGAGPGIEYPVILRKPKHSSLNTNQSHRKPMRESEEDALDNNSFVHSVSVSASPSPSNTYQNHSDREKGSHSRESSVDKTLNSSSLQNSNGNGKPVVRKRVPKTNPYANYPACITGNNSSFPYKLPNTGGVGAGPEDIFTAPGSSNYNNNSTTSNFGCYPNTSGEVSNTNPNPIMNHHRKDSNSSIPILKLSYGGSIGNSSESSSNTETPRNSLPSTPTQSVDVLFPQLHRNNNPSTLPSQNLIRQQLQQSAPNNNYGSISSGSGSSYSQNSYKSNPKSILKDQLLQQQLLSHQSSTSTSSVPMSVDDTEKPDVLKKFQVPPPVTSNMTISNNGNLPNSTNSSPSHIPKINAVRIAVGVRERRNSFRQAVWKEAPNNGQEDSNSASHPLLAQTDASRNISSPLGPSQINQMYNGNSDAVTTSRNTSSTSSSQIPSLPKIHKNYEPIWLDSSVNHNHADHFQSSSTPTTSTALPYSTSLQVTPRIYPNKVQSNNSNSFPYIENTNNRIKSVETNHGHESQDLSSKQKSQQNPAFQSKVDEIKVMLAELNAPVSEIRSKISNKTSNPALGSTGLTVLKQQRSLRAPSRSQYQQGLSCFTFKKPSSYESLVDQLHQEQEQHEQDLEDSDEYQPLIDNTGTSSSSMGSATGVGLGNSSSPIRKEFLYHPTTMRDESVSRNISKGTHAHANDYVTLRQCRTINNAISNSNNSSSSNQAPYQNNSNSSLITTNTNGRQSSSSPEFPKKFSVNSSSSGSPLDSNSNTPVPPPRNKTKRSGGQSSNFSLKSQIANYDREFQTDMANLVHSSWPTAGSSSSSYNQQSNSKSNHYPNTAGINTSTNNSEISRSHRSSYEEYDAGQKNRNHVLEFTLASIASSDDKVENLNSNSLNSNPTTTSPKAIIRALGLFQAKAANVRSRLANWTEAKDRSNGDSKRVHENGNGPPLELSNGKEDDEGIHPSDQAGGPGFVSSRVENLQLPTSGPGHVLGRSKHQYL